MNTGSAYNVGYAITHVLIERVSQFEFKEGWS